jgi:hypothetical protein
MSNDITPPLQVTDNTLEGQIATFARYLLTSVGGFALGKGWIDSEVLQLLTGLVTVAAPTAYGIYKTYTSKQRLITVAEAAPNSVAKVVST